MTYNISDFKTELSMCNGCKLRKGTEPVAGRGNTNKPLIMFVGEAPGRQEAKSGKPFVGVAGKIFERWTKKLGITEDDYYVTNAVKCRPPSNRPPRKDERLKCSGWLEKEIKIVKPKIIVPLGRIAMFALNGTRGKVTKYMGIPVFTMYHPMASLYDPSKEETVQEHLRTLNTIIEDRR